MTEIKTSKLLSKLIEDSREIGNKRNPPFTAERFIVAIINKLNSSVGDIAGQDIDSELLVLTDTIKELIQDLGTAKESLLTYICQEKSTSFLDDLYMKKKMQEASGISKEVKAEELDSITLLLCISDDPSEAIKPVLTKTPTKPTDADETDVSDADLSAALEAKFDELFGVIDDDNGGKKKETEE